MIYLKFLWSLLKHKWYFFQAGRLTGVSLWGCIIHDWSKFTLTEFPRYARRFFGSDKDESEWAIAWNHHLEHNLHHPEHWSTVWRGRFGFYATNIGEKTSDNIIALPMPEKYVREMVADWLAASKAYTGSWNIAKWVNENGPKKNLHSETERLIATVLIELDYFITDNCPWSWVKL